MTETHTITNANDSVTALTESALDCGVPYDGAQTIADYVINKLEPGGFITAVLANDLVGACSHADSQNIRLIPEYARFLYNHLPRGCWGSYETVNAWLKESNDEQP